MITLFQESVPFSNKMFDGKVSQDSKYTNPVIIPYAVNSAVSEDILETVIYVKNDDQGKYYKNVTITLMKEDTTITQVNASGILNFSSDGSTLSVNSILDVPLDLAYDYPGGLPVSSVTLLNAYKTSYIPVIDDPSISVAFSYGYDELSITKWATKSSVLLIPTIGTSGLGDTSYIPIRMRIANSVKTPLITNRNYFIDISYSDELVVGA